MTPRELYEALVGTESQMGIGDFAGFLNKQVLKKLETEGIAVEGGFAFTEFEAEEILRELTELVATGDEFDEEDEEPEEEDEEVVEDEENDEIPEIAGETIESVGDVSREDTALDEDDL